MDKTLKVLQDRLAQTKAAMSAMLETLALEDRVFSADEQTKYTALDEKLTSVLTQLDAQKRLQDAERTIAAPASATPGIAAGHDRATDAPFASLGEQIQAIVNAGTPGGTVDPRLFNAAASGGSAAVGSDGGFLIRKDFAKDLFQAAFDTGVLASRCSRVEISAESDGLEVAYLDETSRATGSRWGGVQVYRVAEADTVTATKPKLGKWDCRLEDMMGLAYLTNRLAQDAGAVGQIYTDAFASEMAFKLDDEIVRGTGVGQCLGILSAACTVTQTKEGSQTADTVNAENVQNMYARLPLRSRANAAWFVTPANEIQLQRMQSGATYASQLVYMPPGGFSAKPWGTLFGLPVLPIEHASAIGDLGDIILADLSQYQLITKGGTQQDESIHVRFIYGEKTLRWITRVNGMPRLKSALTPYKGALTLSPFVILEAR